MYRSLRYGGRRVQLHLQLSGDWYVPHKAQKRSLRRKCEDYAVDSGVLYRKKERERGEMEFLRVPRGVEERERILHSCHSSKESEYD